MKLFFAILCLLIVGLTGRGQVAPVTAAAVVTSALPGALNVPAPVTVTGFTAVGDFTLTMVFDTTKVRFKGAVPTALLPGMTVTYSVTPGFPEGRLVLAWTGAANTSLPDGTAIANLTFHYVTGTGLLVWIYSGDNVCRYRRWSGGVLTVMDDTPKEAFYRNGGISNRGGPLVFAPVIEGPAAGALSLAVTTSAFNTIGGMTLYLEYDPALITYLGTFTKNPAFVSGFVVGNINGNGGKKIIVIQWFGGNVSLPDNATLVTLNFSYPALSCDACPLNWYDNGPSCEFSDNTGNTLIDMPRESYYFDGVVTEGLVTTWTGSAGSAWDNAANWNACGIPGITRRIVIPDVSPNSFPVVTTTAACKAFILQTGATLTVSPTGVLAVGQTQ